MQSSPDPMDVLFNIHLDLIRATETVSVPPPFNTQQHEVGTLGMLPQVWFTRTKILITFQHM